MLNLSCDCFFSSLLCGVQRAWHMCTGYLGMWSSLTTRQSSHSFQSVYILNTSLLVSSLKETKKSLIVFKYAREQAQEVYVERDLMLMQCTLYCKCLSSSEACVPLFFVPIAGTCLFSRWGSVLYIFSTLSTLSSQKCEVCELSHQKRVFPLHTKELLSLHPKPVWQPTPPVAIHTYWDVSAETKKWEGQWVVGSLSAA